MPTDLERTFEQLRLALVYGNVSVESNVPHPVRLSAAWFLRGALEGVVDDDKIWVEMEDRVRVTADMGIDPEQIADLIRILQDVVGAEMAVVLTGAGYTVPLPPSVSKLITEVQQLIRLDPGAVRQLGDVRGALKGFVEQLDLDKVEDDPRAVRRWLLKGRAVAGTLVTFTFRTASFQVSPIPDAMSVGIDQERTADAMVASAGISAVREALAASRIRTGFGSPSAQRVGSLAERVLRRVSSGSPQLDVEEKLLAAQQRAASGDSASDTTPRYRRDVINILKYGHGQEARRLRRNLEQHEHASDARDSIDQTVDRLRLRASWEERAHAWEERIKAYVPWRFGSGDEVDEKTDGDGGST